MKTRLPNLFELMNIYESRYNTWTSSMRRSRLDRRIANDCLRMQAIMLEPVLLLRSYVLDTDCACYNGVDWAIIQSEDKNSR